MLTASLGEVFAYPRQSSYLVEALQNSEYETATKSQLQENSGHDINIGHFSSAVAYPVKNK